MKKIEFISFRLNRFVINYFGIILIKNLPLTNWFHFYLDNNTISLRTFLDFPSIFWRQVLNLEPILIFQILIVKYNLYWRLSTTKIQNKINFANGKKKHKVLACCRNVGKNVFEHLPTKGLERLLHLKTFNNPNLRQFPTPEHFPRIQSLVLSYAYHCCSFLPPESSEDDPPPSSESSLHESVIFPANENEFDMTLWNSSMSDIWPQLR